MHCRMIASNLVASIAMWFHRKTAIRLSRSVFVFENRSFTTFESIPSLAVCSVAASKRERKSGMFHFAFQVLATCSMVDCHFCGKRAANARPFGFSQRPPAAYSSIGQFRSKLLKIEKEPTLIFANIQQVFQLVECSCRSSDYSQMNWTKWRIGWHVRAGSLLLF